MYASHEPADTEVCLETYERCMLHVNKGVPCTHLLSFLRAHELLGSLVVVPSSHRAVAHPYALSPCRPGCHQGHPRALRVRCASCMPACV